jgi:UDP-N-acetylmuramyl pentapeptide phosphotransferase/UDP-N-acetylglucosamine-1-phosphate transferase
MVAYYWETRDGSLVRLAIYVAAVAVFLISAVPSLSTFVILLFGIIGLTGILDEYRRWRRAVTSRRRPG